MAAFVPATLLEYLLLFRSHFTKPSFTYFGGYILSLLLTSGRKTMSRVAHTCFFVERHLVSWERFLSAHKWDLHAVLRTLLDMLLAQLGNGLQVHGAYLAALDTFLVAKNGRAMPGVQAWRDHSGNADRGERIRGHHWALLGLIGFSATWGRYLCFPLLLHLISGQLNPCQWVVDPTPLIQEGIHLISRLRKDAVGWDDPSPEQRADAKRGQKWKLAHLLAHLPATAVEVFLYGKQVTVHAVSRIVWLRGVEQRVKVVVICVQIAPAKAFGKIGLGTEICPAHVAVCQNVCFVI